MKLRVATIFAILTLVSAVSVVPAAASTAGASSAAQPAASSGLVVNPFSSTLFNSVGTAVGSVSGTLTITKFVVQNGQLVAQGVLNGTATVNGVTTTLTNVAFSAPVTGAASAAACTILNLTLGPINLDLLGLVVQTNTIHLQITAVPGAGNLLGNLLCGIANLFNNGQLGAVAGILNRILIALEAVQL